MTNKKETEKVRTSESKKIVSVSKKMKEAEKKQQEKIQAEDKRLYRRCVSSIEREYKKVESSSLNIAFLLYSVYAKKLYKIDSYKNIYDFAKDKFELARGTTNNFINICERFGVKDDQGFVTALQEQYKDYGMSKLSVLLNCPDSFIEQCDPVMSVRTIREMKREYTDLLEASISDAKEENSVADNHESGFMSEPACDEDGVILDVPSNAKDLFVCSANSYEDLLKLRDIIEESLRDAERFNHFNKNDSKPHLEVKVVF